MTKLEQVARAIFPGIDPPTPYSLHAASAAVEVLLDPSDEMLEAAAQGGAFTSQYRAMITSILTKMDIIMARCDIDIIEILEHAASAGSSTYNVGDDTVRIRCGSLKDAAKEIKKLRERVEALEGDQHD
jgi:hypothetical protein